MQNRLSTRGTEGQRQAARLETLTLWETPTSARVEVGGPMQDDEMQEQGRGVHLHRSRQEPAEELHVPAKGSQLRAPAHLPSPGGAGGQ